MTTQYEIKPKYKIPKQIEAEALEILSYYNPQYITNLSSTLDYHDFLFDFLPNYLSRKFYDKLEISFFDNALKDAEGNRIVGYTEANGVHVDREFFDSKDPQKNRIFNWMSIHEGYHIIGHRQYLKSMENQLPLFSNLVVAKPKLNRIVTLQRDLGGSISNYFCLQANMFASYLTMPRERLKKAILETDGKETIEIEPEALDDHSEEIGVFRDEAWRLQRHFDLNVTPLAIALKSYGLAKIKNKNELSLF